MLQSTPSVDETYTVDRSSGAKLERFWTILGVVVALIVAVCTGVAYMSEKLVTVSNLEIYAKKEEIESKYVSRRDVEKFEKLEGELAEARKAVEALKQQGAVLQCLLLGQHARTQKMKAGLDGISKAMRAALQEQKTGAHRDGTYGKAVIDAMSAATGIIDEGEKAPDLEGLNCVSLK